MNADRPDHAAVGARQGRPRHIDWVTPEHVVPQIFEALPLAVERGLRLPTVYNTSSYLHAVVERAVAALFAKRDEACGEDPRAGA